MRTNQPIRNPLFTHEGAPAVRITAYQQLRRSVLSCMLFENEFYEDGQEISARIAEFATQVEPAKVALLAVEARSQMNLRHVPLLLASILARVAPGTALVSEMIEGIVQRPDELAELLAIHAKLQGVGIDKIKPKISAQMKKGLARAFRKFDSYQLAKYDRDGAIKMRDVMFLVHPKPANEEQAALWKSLIDGTLASPDTWEVALSAGADKAATFARLIAEGKLGYLALLRNLRKMAEVGVEPAVVRQAILARKGSRRVLPFRYVAAARACPQYEPELDYALQASIKQTEALPGMTHVLLDVSGSMEEKLSAKSDMKRMDAAAVLGSIIPGQCRVFTFSDHLVEVPPRKGMAGVDAIVNSQSHQGTRLGDALATLAPLPCERIIVVTDEQSHDRVPPPPAGARGYMINVASYRNGVGYGAWNHLDGFSEQVLRWILEFERPPEVWER